MPNCIFHVFTTVASHLIVLEPTFWSNRKFSIGSMVLKLISRETARRSSILTGIFALCSTPDDDRSLFSCQIILPVSASRIIIQLLHRRPLREMEKKRRKKKWVKPQRCFFLIFVVSCMKLNVNNAKAKGKRTKQQKKSHNSNLHLKTILYFFRAIFIGRRAVATHFAFNAITIFWKLSKLFTDWNNFTCARFESNTMRMQNDEFDWNKLHFCGLLLCFCVQWKNCHLSEMLSHIWAIRWLFNACDAKVLNCRNSCDTNHPNVP